MLDPFAGVGGTLLGAAIARGPRRALGIELDPRWVGVYETVVRDLLGERDGAGPAARRPRHRRSGRPAAFDPCGLELRFGDALALLPDARARLASTSSRPTRRTTSSCR